MRRIFIVLFSIALSTGISSAQKEKSTPLKCNIEIILEMSEKIENCNEKLILNFLQTFGQECKNNAEFSEFGNETLFKVIQKQPKLFCEVLEEYKSKIDLNSIILQIENPVIDLINLDSIKEQVSHTKISQELKNTILNAIDRAIEKTK
ncbi:hypothetical protein [uncultured Draconibacterium sp.]|uniref:hypothetical protein n=1 Tax=uncultured Draconibacterium sp. TaxID=1573823 RepID=UPI002AA70BC3|nr:hypothetical protein [uncultured Draconibacterium sp.]